MSRTLTTHRQETRPVREIVANWAEMVAKAKAMLPAPVAERLLREAEEPGC